MTDQHAASRASDRTPAATAEPVASTKFVPPRSVPGLLPREALLQRLMEARRKRCIVVQGPPGAGKTTTLLALRRLLMTHGFEVAWLSLTPEDNELGMFFECLLASLGRVDAAGVQAAALLGGAGGADTQALEHRVIALAQGLSQRSEPLVLMLDDAHWLTDPRVLQALQWLLDYAPARLHLVLASRDAFAHPLGTALARLRQLQAGIEIGAADLRLSPAETGRFLRERLGSVTDAEALRLHELTDGWIAGLQLIAMNCERLGAAALAMPLRDADGFAAYFEREVLAHLSAEDLALLSAAAVCNRFCAGLCRALLDSPEPAARLQQRLARLERGNLFITQVQGRDEAVWWRLHPLLREVLHARLAQQGSDAALPLHRRAWQWFSAHGSVVEAVRHAVVARECEAAAQMVDACARTLLAQGEFGQLLGLLRLLPPQALEDHSGLRLARAQVHLHSRELPALDQDIAALAGLALAPLQRAELDLLRCGAALQRDDADDRPRRGVATSHARRAAVTRRACASRGSPWPAPGPPTPWRRARRP